MHMDGYSSMASGIRNKIELDRFTTLFSILADLWFDLQPPSRGIFNRILSICLTFPRILKVFKHHQSDCAANNLNPTSNGRPQVFQPLALHFCTSLL